MSFLDYRCDNCSEEEHDICWVDKPDLDCVCCRETLSLESGMHDGRLILAESGRRMHEIQTQRLP